MNLFDLLDVSGSALTAERQRAEVEASNLANAETTRTESGGPYRRKSVVFATSPAGSSAFGGMLNAAQGVRVERTISDSAPPLRRFEPGHPDADTDGYVAYPAINPVEAMLNLTEASRAYQLNVAAVQATKGMIAESLQILT